jgi:DNA modification methylase
MKKQKLLSAIVPLARVREWDKNPRTVQPKDFERLKKQIQKFGVYKPLICCRENGHYIVLGGNMRLRALQELGHREVWISEVMPKSEAEKIEISLSDNDRIGAYDEKGLADLLRPLQEQLDLDAFKVDLKFPELDLGRILDRQAVGNPEDDQVPEVRKTNIKLGDMFQLGEHRLLCGDATKQEDMAKLTNGEKADMVFTDPPYGVDYEGGGRNEDKRDKIIGDQSSELYYPALKIAYDFTIDKAAIYLWFAESEIQAVIQAVIQADFKIRNLLIWNKLNAHYGCLNAQYKQRHEPFLYLHKKNKSPNWYGSINECTVWDIEQSHINEFHPTQKPIALAERAITNSSQRENIVLDLFLGSGSTLIACEKLDRICYGMEISPVYCQVIIDRWEKFTGRKAVNYEK